MVVEVMGRLKIKKNWASFELWLETIRLRAWEGFHDLNLSKEANAAYLYHCSAKSMHTGISIIVTRDINLTGNEDPWPKDPAYGQCLHLSVAFEKSDMRVIDRDIEVLATCINCVFQGHKVNPIWIEGPNDDPEMNVQFWHFRRFYLDKDFVIPMQFTSPEAEAIFRQQGWFLETDSKASEITPQKETAQ